jgi:uncharacterized membrane protein YgcG
MRLRTALLVATLAGVTASCGSHPVTLDAKTKQCVDDTTHNVVARHRCDTTPAPDDPGWIYLFTMSNGTSRSVPASTYLATPIGKIYDSDEDEPGDEVDETDGEITEQDGSGDDQDGTSGDNGDDGGGSDGDDGGDSGGDDGGGGGDD